MVKLELVHEIECDKASFWSSFFDAELSKATRKAQTGWLLASPDSARR